MKTTKTKAAKPTRRQRLQARIDRYTKRIMKSKARIVRYEERIKVLQGRMKQLDKPVAKKAA